jgi:hypothetical protein
MHTFITVPTRSPTAPSTPSSRYLLYLSMPIDPYIEESSLSASCVDVLQQAVSTLVQTKSLVALSEHHQLEKHTEIQDLGHGKNPGESESESEDSKPRAFQVVHSMYELYHACLRRISAQ